jgi:hypothetical protein
MYSFTNFICSNHFFAIPAALYSLGGGTHAILLVANEHAKNRITNHLDVIKNTPVSINPYFWSDQRMPEAIEILQAKIVKKDIMINLLEDGTVNLPKNYNRWI